MHDQPPMHFQNEASYPEPIFPEKSEGYPNVGQSFVALLILLGMAIAVQLPLALLQMWLPQRITGNDTFYLAFNFVAYALTFLFTALILLSKKEKKEHTRYQWFRLGDIKPFEIILLLVLTILMGVATEPVYKIVPSIDWIDKLMYEELKRLIQPHILSFCIIALLPAIFEETLMRGIILDGLLKRYSPVSSILLSSFLFGLMHLNPMQFVGGMIAGIFLGWVYWKTKSLVACMVIHGTNNAFSYFLSLKFGIDAYLSQMVSQSTYIILVIVSSVLFIGGIWWLSVRWRKGIA